MHHALTLPDILSSIIAHCDRPTTACMAAVCRRWSETANDVLWKNITHIWTLLEVFSPLDNSDFGMIFSRPYSSAAARWDRFLMHANRVQELEYNSDNEGHRPVAPDTFTILATLRPQIDLTPNLRRLVWQIFSDIYLAHAMVFMSAHVEDLHLIFDPMVPVDTFRDFLADLPRLCPGLRRLVLDVRSPVHYLEPVLSNTLSALPLLEDIGLPAFCISSSILHGLSTHPNLRKIHARAFWASRFYGSSDDVKDLSLSGVSTDGFPRLQDLEIDGAFSVVEKVLAAPCICMRRSITRLYISTFEQERLYNLQHLLTFIADEFAGALTYLGIGYLVKPADLEIPGTHGEFDAPVAFTAMPRITFDTLRPALRLRKLKKFLISHNVPLLLTEANIAEMGAAWAEGELRFLKLVSDPVMVNEVPIETELTLKSLEWFAKYLPNLTHLEVFVDASKDLPTSPPIASFAHLETLDVGTSPIAFLDHCRIARWLSQLVPHTFNIAYDQGWTTMWADTSADLENIIHTRRASWEMTQWVHKELCLVGEGNRKEICRWEEDIDAKERSIVKMKDSLVEKDRRIAHLEGKVAECEGRVLQLEDELRLLRVTQQPTGTHSSAATAKLIPSVLHEGVAVAQGIEVRRPSLHRRTTLVTSP